MKFVRVGVAQNGDSVTVKLTHAGYNFFAVLEPTGVALDPCATSGGPGGGIGGAIRSLGRPLRAVNPGAHIRPRLPAAHFPALFGLPSRPTPRLGGLPAPPPHTPP